MYISIEYRYLLVVNANSMLFLLYRKAIMSGTAIATISNAVRIIAEIVCIVDEQIIPGAAAHRRLLRK